MWNKKIVFLILGIMAVSALSYGQDAAARRFDPMKPVLTTGIVNQIMTGKIQKKLLERKLPEKLDEIKKPDDGLTVLAYAECIANLERLLANPELPEVTRIPVSWYRTYGVFLKKLEVPVLELNSALSYKNQDRYAAALAELKKQQQICLDFLKKKPPRIPSEELSRIRSINTRRRQAEYNEKVRKRKEEQRKKLQEEREKKQKK